MTALGVLLFLALVLPEAPSWQSLAAELNENPVLHVMPHTPLLHVATPEIGASRGVLHLLFLVPQLLTSEEYDELMQSVPAVFSCRPELQERSQAELVQIAEPVPAVSGPGHLLFSLPQLLTSVTVLTVGAQSVFAEFSVKPLLQVIAQVDAAQVAVPVLAVNGLGHLLFDLPQLLTSVVYGLVAEH